MTLSTMTHLVGSLSGAVYDADRLWRTDPVDGRPLQARYDSQVAARTLTKAAMATRRTNGMWRWAELLPVRSPGRRIYLGEGATPLLSAPGAGRALDVPRLMVKCEGGNPTGSFKARGMAAAVSRAAELGASAFIAPSAGNAAGALATYGAAAGLPVTVVMPSDVPVAHRVESILAGARVLLVDGLISDCGLIAGRIAQATGAFDVSTFKEPYRVEGKKTMGLELAEDLGWRLPDVVVYPTGGGTGLVGMWKAFDELQALGLIGGERPRMVGVQVAGCAPIVRAFTDGQRFARPWEGARTRAAGIRVPGAVGDFLILDALRASGGTAIAVDEAEMDDAQGLAGRCGLGYVSPETAAALAAVGQLRSSGWLSRDDQVVMFDTGVGHKYPPPPDVPEPAVVAADEDDVDRLLNLAAGP
ncbi:MAG: threonine synthase [Nitriliruptorales bacterium]|nr:threonine synthase [Nitriliruptorales bacterium]